MGNYFLPDDACAECDSLNLVYPGEAVWNDALVMWQFPVQCQDCGAEWIDVREDEVL